MTCSSEPWVDLEDSALVPESAATVFGERLPPGLIGPVSVSEDRMLRLRSAERVRDDVLHGVVVRSPIMASAPGDGVYVVRAAIERDEPHAIERGMTLGGFGELERELRVEDWFVDCPDCGDTVKRSRVNLHRAKCTLCRLRRAGAEVRRLWEADWRVPSSTTAPAKPESRSPATDTSLGFLYNGPVSMALTASRRAAAEVRCSAVPQVQGTDRSDLVWVHQARRPAGREASPDVRHRRAG